MLVQKQSLEQIAAPTKVTIAKVIPSKKVSENILSKSMISGLKLTKASTSTQQQVMHLRNSYIAKDETKSRDVSGSNWSEEGRFRSSASMQNDKSQTIANDEAYRNYKRLSENARHV